MEVIRLATNFLGMFAPLAAIAIGLLTAWGIVKWLRKLGFAVKGLSENPFTLIFGLIAAGLALFAYFEYVAPLFNKL